MIPAFVLVQCMGVIGSPTFHACLAPMHGAVQADRLHFGVLEAGRYSLLAGAC